MAANKRKFQGHVAIADVEMPEAPAAEVEQDNRGLRERALLVRTTTTFWHGIGADHEVTEEIRRNKEASGDAGTFVKRLMDKSVLKELLRCIRTWKQYEKEHSLPWGERGLRLLSIDAFFAYKKQAAIATREFQLLVDKLVQQYPAAVEAQKRRLGKMWRATDYPSVDQIRDAYSLRVLVEPIPMSDDFRIKLSKDEAEEIRRVYDAEVSARLKGAIRDVYDRMHEMVGELREKLADSDTNVRKGSFEALRKLCATLPQLNVAVQDPHIRELGNQIARDLIAVDAGAINDDTTMRNDVKSKADKLLAALKPLRSNWTSGDTNDNSNPQ